MNKMDFSNSCRICFSQTDALSFVAIYGYENGDGKIAAELFTICGVKVRKINSLNH